MVALAVLTTAPLEQKQPGSPPVAQPGSPPVAEERGLAAPVEGRARREEQGPHARPLLTPCLQGRGARRPHPPAMRPSRGIAVVAARPPRPPNMLQAAVPLTVKPPGHHAPAHRQQQKGWQPGSPPVPASWLGQVPRGARPTVPLPVSLPSPLGGPMGGPGGWWNGSWATPPLGGEWVGAGRVPRGIRGGEQSCVVDPKPTLIDEKDPTRTCDDNNTVKETGAKAAFDKGVAGPGEDGQACKDPNMKYSRRNDVICTCEKGPSRTSIGAAERGDGQTRVADTGRAKGCAVQLTPRRLRVRTPAVFASMHRNNTYRIALTGCETPRAAGHYDNGHITTCGAITTAGLAHSNGTFSTAFPVCGTRWATGDSDDTICRQLTSTKEVGCMLDCSVYRAARTHGERLATGDDKGKVRVRGLKGLRSATVRERRSGVVYSMARSGLRKFSGPGGMCGGRQTCADPKPALSDLKGSTCTCVDNNTVTVTGVKTTYTRDEAVAKPGGDGRTKDPNMKCLGDDVICTRGKDPSLTNTGAHVWGDEQSRTRRDDVIGTCDEDPSLTDTGASAAGSKGECESKRAGPGGGGQTSGDPRPTLTGLKTVCGSGNDGTCGAGWGLHGRARLLRVLWWAAQRSGIMGPMVAGVALLCGDVGASVAWVAQVTGRAAWGLMAAGRLRVARLQLVWIGWTLWCGASVEAEAGGWEGLPGCSAVLLSAGWLGAQWAILRARVAWWPSVAQACILALWMVVALAGVADPMGLLPAWGAEGFVWMDGAAGAAGGWVLELCGVASPWLLLGGAQLSIWWLFGTRRRKGRQPRRRWRARRPGRAVSQWWVGGGRLLMRRSAVMGVRGFRDARSEGSVMCPGPGLGVKCGSSECWRPHGPPEEALAELRGVGVRSCVPGENLEVSAGALQRWADTGECVVVWVQGGQQPVVYAAPSYRAKTRAALRRYPKVVLAPSETGVACAVTSEAQATRLMERGLLVWDGSAPRLQLPPDALRGGGKGPDMRDVDASLPAGASRVPNASLNDCGYLALGYKQGDVQGVRETIATLATQQPSLRNMLGTAEAYAGYLAGVRGERHMDHLTLQLVARQGRFQVLVVQPGQPNLLIGPKPKRPKAERGPGKVSTSPVKVVALAGGHYEQVRIGDTVRETVMAQLEEGARSPILTARNAVEQPSESSGEEDLTGKLVDVPTAGRWCPIDSCSRSLVQGGAPFASKSYLTPHMDGHMAEGCFGPHAMQEILRQAGLRTCAVCSRVMSLLASRRKAEEVCDRCHPTVQEEEIGSPSSAQGRYEGLPSWEQIAQADVRTWESVPKELQGEWAGLFRDACREVATTQTDGSWRVLAMLPLLVLRKEKMGKSRKAQTLRQRRMMLGRLRQGEFAQVWAAEAGKRQPAGPSRASRGSQDPTEEHRRWQGRVQKLTAQGRTSAAVKALTPEAVAPKDTDTLKKLKAKHPVGKVARCSKPDATLCDAFSPLQVLQGVKGFPTGSAGGALGLRPDHLKAAVTHPTARALPALTHLVNAMARGAAPASVQPWLAGANLTALRKSEKEVRPIACGESLRRLVAKLLAARHRDEAKAVLLRSGQVGVAVRQGAEAATAVTANYAARRRGQDACILKVDFTNAFNAVDRSAFLREVEQKFPGMLPWVAWCYASPSKLQFGKECVTSSCGVQQGDPLGPLLFSLAIAPVAEEVKQIKGIHGAVWYLDDGVIMGSGYAVGQAYRLIVERCKHLGLQVREDKCELVDLSGRGTGHSVQEWAGWGLKVVEKPKNSPIPGIRWMRDGNFELLGAPIGDAAWCEQFMSERVDQFVTSLDALDKLTDSQTAFALLRECLGFARMVFFMRAIGFKGVTGYLERYDARVQRSLAKLLGYDDDCLPQEAMLQASLPVRIGGLGIRKSADHWHAAALASSAGTAALCRRLDRDFVWDAEGWRQTASSYNEMVAEGWRLDTEAPPERAPEQRSLSLGILERWYNALMDEADAVTRARMQSLLLPGCGAWLTGNPARWEAMPPLPFQAVLRYRLGLPLYESLARCECCGKDGVMDAHGLHATLCEKGGGAITRHEAVADALLRAARQGGLRAERETLGLLEGDRRRPGDVTLQQGFLDGRVTAIDVAVVNPLAPSFLQLAARTVGGAAARRQTTKVWKYREDEAVRTGRLAFEPFVVELFGGWGQRAHSIMNRLVSLGAAKLGVGRVQVAQQTARSMGWAFQKAVGASLESCGRLCTVAGQGRQRVELTKTPVIDPETYVKFGDLMPGVVMEEVPPDAPDVDEDEGSEGDDAPPSDPTPQEERVFDAKLAQWRRRCDPGGSRTVGQCVTGCAASLPAWYQLKQLGAVLPRGKAGDGLSAIMAGRGAPCSLSQARRQAVALVLHAPALRREVDDPTEWSRRMLAPQEADGSMAECAWADLALLRALAVVTRSEILVIRDFGEPVLCRPAPGAQVGGRFSLCAVGKGFVRVDVDMDLSQMPEGPEAELGTQMDRVVAGDKGAECHICAVEIPPRARHLRCGHCMRAACEACGGSGLPCACPKIQLVKASEAGRSQGWAAPTGVKQEMEVDAAEDQAEAGETSIGGCVYLDGCAPTPQGTPMATDANAEPASEEERQAREASRWQLVQELAGTEPVAAFIAQWQSAAPSDVSQCLGVEELVRSLQGQVRWKAAYTVGDCLFDAVVAQLPTGLKVTAAEARTRAVKAVMQHAGLRTMVEGGEPEVWAQQMSRRGAGPGLQSWADELVLGGLARALRITILSFRRQGCGVRVWRAAERAVAMAAVAFVDESGQADGTAVGHFVPVVLPEPLQQWAREVDTCPVGQDKRVRGCEQAKRMRLQVGWQTSCGACTTPVGPRGCWGCGECGVAVCLTCRERCPTAYRGCSGAPPVPPPTGSRGPRQTGGDVTSLGEGSNNKPSAIPQQTTEAQTSGAAEEAPRAARASAEAATAAPATTTTATTAAETTPLGEGSTTTPSAILQQAPASAATTTAAVQEALPQGDFAFDDDEVQEDLSQEDVDVDDDEVQEEMSDNVAEQSDGSMGGNQQQTATRVSWVRIPAERARKEQWAGSSEDGTAMVEGVRVFPCAAMAAASGAADAACIPDSADGWEGLFGRNGPHAGAAATAHCVFKQWIADRRAVDATYYTTGGRQGSQEGNAEYLACKRVDSHANKRQKAALKRKRRVQRQERDRRDGGRGSGDCRDRRGGDGAGRGSGRERRAGRHEPTIMGAGRGARR